VSGWSWDLSDEKFPVVYGSPEKMDGLIFQGIMIYSMSWEDWESRWKF
jgi:hypothetical protein